MFPVFLSPHPENYVTVFIMNNAMRVLILRLTSQNMFFVEHEVKHSVDAGTWRKDIITLRKLNYKEADSVVVNPHYFGEVKLTPKNSDIVNFVTVGAIQGKKKNNDLIINSVKELHEKGIRNFKITVIGKGHLKKLPKELQQYFDIKGRLPFDKMYDEIEKADFLITSYDRDQTRTYQVQHNRNKRKLPACIRICKTLYYY